QLLISEMASTMLPTELWERILSFCDHPSTCALSKVCQRLDAIVTSRNERVLNKCRSEGITLPADAILAHCLGNADLPLDARLLLAHNPFGCCIFPSTSTVRGFNVGDNEGRQTFLRNEEMEKGTIEFTLDYESIGIPRWIVDGIRPKAITMAGSIQSCRTSP
ncbi:hypothetical protein PENTCL1PPCAC_14031, partial [Pristionchus entomophagus]